MADFLFLVLLTAGQAIATVTNETCAVPASAKLMLQVGKSSDATAVVAKGSPKVKVKPKGGGGLFDAYMTADPAAEDMPSDHSEGNKSISSCGVPVQVDESYNISAICPEACPFFAAKADAEFCSFVCVVAEECKKYDPSAPIADESSWSCRAASVNGCHLPNNDGSDSCVECASGYTLTEDGSCELTYWKAMLCAGIFLGVVFLFILYYVVDLLLRPATNAEGLKDALSSRSRQKYHKTVESDGQNRRLWPLTTNLCKEPVGGPGLCLHFRFQAALTIWALIVGLSWLALSYAVDTDLLILGRRPYGSAYRNCILVAWGHSRQMSLMWIKLLFIAGLYIASFLGALLFGVMQLRYFQTVDFEQDTMKDFAALITGLPKVAGSTLLEEELAKLVSETGGQKVVGISVCWEFSHSQEVVMRQLRTEERVTSPRQTETGEENMNFMRQKLFKLEQKVLLQEQNDEALADSAAKDMLTSMKCSSQAFVIFETEKARDAAVEAVKHGFLFRGGQLKMEASFVEPEAVYWQNFDNSSMLVKLTRLAKGMGFILLGLTVWACVFYFPYAWSIFTFNYTGGAMPGLAYSMAFSMIVVIGNLSMVEICNRVSDFVGCKFKDMRELCYMILYLIAVSLNILLDVWTTYYMSEQIMINLHFRTWDGYLLNEVELFMDRFEAYAMQRSMGQNLYEYAWPATYLVPFIAEPVFAIYMLMRIGIMMVRSHPELQPYLAAEWLQAAPMELGRYADCLLNVVLAIMMLFFPGGYTHLTFIFMAASHAYIYVFDHWRVLRVVPAAMFNGIDVDWWAQAVLAPCCGMILACLIFKGNCITSEYCVDAPILFEVCLAAVVGHSVFHVLLLYYVVPVFGLDASGRHMRERTFKDVAKCTPCSWFSSNPVHCLRSKYVFGDSPSCKFYSSGSESHLEVNEKIGCFYQGRPPDDEDVDSFEIKLPATGWLSGLGLKLGLGKDEIPPNPAG